MAISETLKIMKGTLDVLVLKALNQEPMHGFEIVTWIEASSRGGLGIVDSALYQALYRMEGRGLVAADWGVTDNNRRARYYEITERGRRHLEAETERWMRYADLVSSVLSSSPEPAGGV